MTANRRTTQIMNQMSLQGNQRHRDGRRIDVTHPRQATLHHQQTTEPRQGKGQQNRANQSAMVVGNGKVPQHAIIARQHQDRHHHRGATNQLSGLGMSARRQQIGNRYRHQIIHWIDGMRQQQPRTGRLEVLVDGLSGVPELDDGESVDGQREGADDQEEGEGQVVVGQDEADDADDAHQGGQGIDA